MTMLIRPLLMIGKRSLKVLYRSQCSDISNPIHIPPQLCYLYQWWCHHYYSPNVAFGAIKNSWLEKVLSSLITRLPASWRRAVRKGEEGGEERKEGKASWRSTSLYEQFPWKLTLGQFLWNSKLSMKTFTFGCFLFNCSGFIERPNRQFCLIVTENPTQWWWQRQIKPRWPIDPSLQACLPEDY